MKKEMVFVEKDTFENSCHQHLLQSKAVGESLAASNGKNKKRRKSRAGVQCVFSITDGFVLASASLGESYNEHAW